MSVATFTKSGNKSTTAVTLPKSVFNVEVGNHELVKSAYVAYLANGRPNLARTKTRGEIRGGGKKPWKQKGTGRARFGSTRNPIWRGGGIVFGPTGLENYSHKLSTKAKRTAITHALSLKNEAKNIIVIDEFNFSDGKTKQAVELLDKIGATGNVLLVTVSKSDDISRATNNLGNVKLVTAKYLNVYDILNANKIVIAKDAVDVIDEWLGGK